MESAPLTLAHTHARNAAIETKRSNPVAASEEHDLAAAEFAAAAQGTSDHEALRILNLLEQHHKKLGQLLKARHERPVVEDAISISAATANPDAVEATNTTKQILPPPATSDTTIHPPRLARPARSNARDLSSSIASNLASARGIPSNRQNRPTPISPLVSNQHADGLFAQEDSRKRSVGRRDSDAPETSPTTKQTQSRPSWAPPLSSNGSGESANAPVPDAPFQQFYSTFESLISKLSAPLAFAGLPLNITSAKTDTSAAQPTAKASTTPKQTDPTPALDYSQLISRAALQAVHSNAPGGASYNPSESFYVVPTTGGTISYAEIMNRADREEARTYRHHRQVSNLSNISEDDFVDAPSTLLPERGQGGGRVRRGTNEAKVNGKTMEELSLENQALKHLSDTLAKRLHVFEMSAQTSSAALAQSIRSLQRSPLNTPEPSRGKSSRKDHHHHYNSSTGGNTTNPNNEGLAKRITELEEILRKSDARARKKEDENAKLRETIVKYREKWESLKAGAKARREGQTKDRDRDRDKDRDRSGSKASGGSTSGGAKANLTTPAAATTVPDGPGDADNLETIDS